MIHDGLWVVVLTGNFVAANCRFVRHCNAKTNN